MFHLESYECVRSQTGRGIHTVCLSNRSSAHLFSHCLSPFSSSLWSWAGPFYKYYTTCFHIVWSSVYLFDSVFTLLFKSPGQLNKRIMLHISFKSENYSSTIRNALGWSCPHGTWAALFPSSQEEPWGSICPLWFWQTH